MGGVTDDIQARVLLGLWFEAGDRALGSRVVTHTAITVVEEILAGRSPLAEAARPRMQAQPNVEEHLTKVWTAAERVGARFVVPGGSEWPRQLDDLGLEAPLGLWVCGAGDMRLLALRSGPCGYRLRRVSGAGVGCAPLRRGLAHGVGWSIRHRRRSA